MPGLLVVGISHHQAPLEVRERVALDEACWRQVAPRSVPSVLLSTCNRVEVYAGVDSPETLEALRSHVIEGRALPPGLKAHLYAHEGESALRHLFRVASSLD